MVDIDNKKMWESIIDILDTTVANNDIESRFIGFLKATVMKGLADQTLEYKDGHIVSILEHGADFKIERDRFYVCVKSCLNYTVGKVYKSPADGILCADNGMLAYECCLLPDCFRPATEEEIPQEPKFKVGDVIVENNEFGVVGGEITEVSSTHYEVNGERYIPISQQDYFKLVEPKQESSEELTEFEKAIGLEIFDPPFNKEQIAIIKKESKEILLIAYKQFLSERYHNAMHYKLAEILANRFKSSFSSSECNEEDFKRFAAQDAEVAMVFCRKQIANEIQDAISFHLGHAQSDMGTTATDGLNEALKIIKGE